MSWFFGKKKNKESPVDLAEEPSTSSQSDDYILIEKQINPFDPSTSSTNTNNSGNASLYPFLNNRTGNPPPFPSSLDQKNILGDTQTYLNTIQFELNKQLDNDNTEIDRIRVNEISAYLTRIKNAEYDYDFDLEKSVIAEIESTIK